MVVFDGASSQQEVYGSTPKVLFVGYASVPALQDLPLCLWTKPIAQLSSIIM